MNRDLRPGPARSAPTRITPRVPLAALVAALLAAGGVTASCSSSGQPPAAARFEAVIDLAEVRQRMDGFGASAAERPLALADDQGIPGAPVVPGAGLARARFLFSTDAKVAYAGGTYPGLGLSMLRLRILPDGTTDSWDTALTALEVAPQLTVWATPWSPPAALKTIVPPATEGSVNAGGLLPSAYDTWADALAAFATAARDRGVPLYGISPQNEPDFITNGWMMCLYTPDELVRLVDLLASRLASAAPGVRIIAPETAYFDTLWNDGSPLLPPGASSAYARALLEDPAASAAVEVLATHQYDVAMRPPGTAVAHALPPGKRLWQTEVCDVQAQGWQPGMDLGLRAGRWVHDAVAVADASAFHWWYLDNYEQGLQGSLQGIVNGDLPPAKLAFAIGQYARFVQPGYDHVAATGEAPAGVAVAAFRDPVAGTVVVVALNAGAAPVQLSARLVGGAAPREVTPWRTSDTEDLARLAPLPLDGDTVSAPLAARSITTLVGTPDAG